MRFLTRLRLISLALCGLLLAAFALAAGGPRILSASATPTPVDPGQSAKLLCKVADAEGVARVVGSVREIPSYEVTFAPEPDGSWAYTIPVPGESKPGTYHIDLKLVGADGQTIEPASGPTTIDVVVSGTAATEAREAAGVTDHGPPRTYMVPMRDGVRLATDVYQGRGKAPWPVILLRTPYGRKNAKLSGLQDYAIVVQDVRGRFDSQGRALILFNDAWGERQDGLDTVNWVSSQRWCNGRIGTTGESYLGLTQNLLAGASPKGVRCQRIEFAPGDVYRDTAYPGGLFFESLMAGWLKQKDWPADNLQLVLAHPTYDSLWRSVNSNARIREKRISIPAVHIGGWYDIFAQGTLDSFVTRSKIAPNQWLVMGPWTHAAIKSDVGELVFPANAAEAPKPGVAAFWFDHWLRGVNNGLTRTPRVHYYVMGACGEAGAPGNVWRTAQSWPIPARPTRYCFASGNRLLSQAPAAGTQRYEYNPANPVATRGGGNLLLPPGPMDQREVEARPDVLTFSTARLAHPVEVTGHITVKLWAASTARDTAFTAKICDVYPGDAGPAPEMRQSRIQGGAGAAPEMRQSRIQGGAGTTPEVRGSGSEGGRSMLITDGALRAACRESLSNPTPLEPGKVYEFNVAVGSTSIIFNKGHRIRVDISSSNAPRFAVHPNVWGEGKPQTATQTVYYGGTHASAVILPIVAHEGK